MRRTIRLGGILLAVFVVARPSRAAGNSVVLSGHVPSLVAKSALVGRAPANEVVQLGLVVNIDQGLLAQTLNNLYGPGSPQNKPFLTPQQFAEKFDLPNKRQLLRNFAQANGLTVDASRDRANSLILSVTGPASAVESAFNIQLNHYRAPDGQVYRSHSTDPLIPASLVPHLSAITGLSNNMGVLHPHLHPSGSPRLLSGATGPGGGLAPADIKNIYQMNTGLNGSGQTVALYELDGYAPSDITSYETQFSITPVTLQNVLVDGYSGAAGPATDEVCLDIEMVAALSPGVTKILVYEAPNGGSGPIDLYNQIASDNMAQVISTSWGLDEIDNAASLNAENAIFSQMATQGQTIYAASGDNGAYDMCGNTTLVVDDPASQPMVTGVGGTSLTGSVSNPVEQVWNNGYLANGCHGSGPAFVATGGGVSGTWSIPSYQSGVVGEFSTTMRNVPDVALNADPNNSPYSIFVSGGWALVGGTSAAAPLWAAQTAQINQARLAAGRGVLGFANPTIYAAGTSVSYSSDFTDISSGPNNGFYNPGIGYDNCTGFGSFKGIAVGGTPSGAAQKPPASSVYPSPNPWDVRTAAGQPLIFRNFSAGDTIKLFTLSGFLVKTLNGPNWDLTNDSGQSVASGLYFFQVTDGNGGKAVGKLAIIR